MRAADLVKIERASLESLQAEVEQCREAKQLSDDESSAWDERSGPPSTVFPPGATEISQLEGFAFRAGPCQISGESVSCEVIVMSENPKPAVELLPTSALVDQQGNTHLLTEATIAGQTTSLATASAFPVRELVSGAESRMELVFGHLPRSFETVQSLVLYLRLGHDGAESLRPKTYHVGIAYSRESQSSTSGAADPTPDDEGEQS